MFFLLVTIENSLLCIELGLLIPHIEHIAKCKLEEEVADSTDPEVDREPSQEGIYALLLRTVHLVVKSFDFPAARPSIILAYMVRVHEVVYVEAEHENQDYIHKRVYSIEQHEPFPLLDTLTVQQRHCKRQHEEEVKAGIAPLVVDT